MRTLLYQTIKGLPALTPYLGDEPRVWPMGTLGKGDIPARPEPVFILYRQLPSTDFPEVRKAGQSNTKTFEVFVYDEAGDYLRIDDVLSILIPAVKSLKLVASPSGARCTDVRWTGNGADGFDADLDMFVRNTTFQFVSNQP
jgi:hypothetical protein